MCGYKKCLSPDEIRNLPKHSYRLLDYVESLHGSNTGISGAMGMDEEVAIFELLRRRITEWDPSPYFSKRYDDAILELIRTVLDETEERSVWRARVAGDEACYPKKVENA